MNKLLISTASLPIAMGKEFTDFHDIPNACSKLDIDGIELVFLPEWDSSAPPITPTSSDWNTAQKVNVIDLANYIKKNMINVPSVHLNRDIGSLLCSDVSNIKRGQKILEENLEAAWLLNSEIAVLHLWDTYKENIDIDFLLKKVYEVSQKYPIKIAIENVPISDKSQNIESIWTHLEEMMPKSYGFTLDLNWCSLYNNFTELSKYISLILNVHVQGYLNQDNKIVPIVGTLDYIPCLHSIKSTNYNRYITLELNRIKGINDYIQSLKFIKTIF